MKYDEIVIKIPREWLNDMAKEEFIHVDELCEIILNGTPLPEHHGEMNIFSYRNTIMWKLKHNEPLEENELRNIEQALTMECLRTEMLSQSIGYHENTFRLSTAMPRIQHNAESEVEE